MARRVSRIFVFMCCLASMPFFLQYFTNKVQKSQDGQRLPRSSENRYLAGGGHNQSRMELRMRMKEILESYASPDRLILIAYVEIGYIEVAINFYLTSLVRFETENYVFLSSDEQSCHVLRAINANCDFIPPYFKVDDTASDFKTEAFNKKTHMKTKLVLDALTLDYKVLLSDLDIVFLKDPQPLLIEEVQGVDFVIQNNTNGANTGFYLIKPTAQSIKLFQSAWDMALSPKGVKKNDQTILIEILKKAVKFHTIKLNYLSVDLYPTGLTYWEMGRRMFLRNDPWQEPSQVIVHNNWIVSKAAKIYRFKESLMWRNDAHGYYSSETVNYLLYENPLNVNSENQTLKDLESKALLNALAIGYILNRTVILPAFHCYDCDSEACNNTARECSLLVHYKIAHFDTYFGNKYREYVFLDNPLTPEEVTSSLSRKMLIISTFTQKAIDERHLTVTDNILTKRPKDAKHGATVSEIQQWYGHLKERVLCFHSFYNAFKGFPQSTTYSSIKSALETALLTSNYRQQK